MTTAVTEAALSLACQVPAPDGWQCGHTGCWRACWECAKDIAAIRVAARLDTELAPDDFEALVTAEWHDVVLHRGYGPETDRWDCEIAAAEYDREREIRAAALAEVPEDGQLRPFTLTSTMIHRADCHVVTGRGTFWRQHLTHEEALATMHRRGGGKTYERCSQCAPDVPEARKVSRQQARIERGEHVKSGLGWPDAMKSANRR